MRVKRLTRMALLTAIALTIFLVEAQVPSPVPGVKLGLANIVTVYAMFALGPVDTLMILLGRIFFGSLFSGQFILYSLTGGLCCYLLMLLLHRILTEDQIFICSILGAVAHVIGQMAVALLLTGTVYILSYLPLLIISAICAGLFTGLCAQLLHKRLNKK